MGRLLGGAWAAGDDLPDVLTDVGDREVLPDLVDDGGLAAAAEADMRTQLMAAAHEQAVHALHVHLPRSRASGHSGLIALLVLLHLCGVVYWALIWVRQRRQRAREEARRGKHTPVGPARVGCDYDFMPKMPAKLPQLPRIPNIQLISHAKSAQH